MYVTTYICYTSLTEQYAVSFRIFLSELISVRRHNREKNMQSLFPIFLQPFIHVFLRSYSTMYILYSIVQYVYYSTMYILYSIVQYNMYTIVLCIYCSTVCILQYYVYNVVQYMYTIVLCIYCSTVCILQHYVYTVVQYVYYMQYYVYTVVQYVYYSTMYRLQFSICILQYYVYTVVQYGYYSTMYILQYSMDTIVLQQISLITLPSLAFLCTWEGFPARITTGPLAESVLINIAKPGGGVQKC